MKRILLIFFVLSYSTIYSQTTILVSPNDSKDANNEWGNTCPQCDVAPSNGVKYGIGVESVSNGMIHLYVGVATTTATNGCIVDRSIPMGFNGTCDVKNNQTPISTGNTFSATDTKVSISIPISSITSSLTIHAEIFGSAYVAHTGSLTLEVVSNSSSRSRVPDNTLLNPQIGSCGSLELDPTAFFDGAISAKRVNLKLQGNNEWDIECGIMNRDINAGISSGVIFPKVFEGKPSGRYDLMVREQVNGVNVHSPYSEPISIDLERMDASIVNHTEDPLTGNCSFELATSHSASNIRVRIYEAVLGQSVSECDGFVIGNVNTDIVEDLTTISSSPSNTIITGITSNLQLNKTYHAIVRASGGGSNYYPFSTQIYTFTTGSGASVGTSQISPINCSKINDGSNDYKLVIAGNHSNIDVIIEKHRGQAGGWSEVGIIPNTNHAFQKNYTSNDPAWDYTNGNVEINVENEINFSTGTYRWKVDLNDGNGFSDYEYFCHNNCLYDPCGVNSGGQSNIPELVFDPISQRFSKSIVLSNRGDYMIYKLTLPKNTFTVLKTINGSGNVSLYAGDSDLSIQNNSVKNAKIKSTNGHTNIFFTDVRERVRIDSEGSDGLGTNSSSNLHESTSFNNEPRTIYLLVYAQNDNVSFDLEGYYSLLQTPFAGDDWAITRAFNKGTAGKGHLGDEKYAIDFDVINCTNAMSVLAPENAKIIKKYEENTTATDPCDNAHAYGNGFKLLIEDSYIVNIAHLESITQGLNENDIINKGDVLGVMGETGCAFGKHIHFELHRYGGSKFPIKPTPLYNGQNYYEIKDDNNYSIWTERIINGVDQPNTTNNTLGSWNCVTGVIQNQILAYPNPNNNTPLNVFHQSNAVGIIIRNYLGNQVYTKTINPSKTTTTIPSGVLNSGTYTITVVYTTGVVSTQTIILL